MTKFKISLHYCFFLVASFFVFVDSYSQSVTTTTLSSGCYTIEGISKDEEGYPVANTEIVFTDIENTIIEKITVGEDGFYRVCIPKGFYKIQGSKEGFNPGFSSIDLDEKTIVAVQRDITLTKGSLRLFGRVRDWSTYDAIKDVKVTLTNQETGEKEFFLTSVDGDFTKELTNKLGDSVIYDVTIEKEGYQTKTVTYTKTIDQYGQQIINYSRDLYMYLDGELPMVAEGDSEDIIINAIYFPSDSYLLTAQAKKELDKIVALMNKYPTMEIEVGSHTDCEENRWYNEWLSYKRAKSSRLYVRARLKVNKDRITGKGYGEYRLLNDCACEGAVKSNCSAEENQLNRRTEFRIINRGESTNVNIVNLSPNSFDPIEK